MGAIIQVNAGTVARHSTLYLLSCRISKVYTREAEQVEHDRWVLIFIARGLVMKGLLSQCCVSYSHGPQCVWASSCLSASAALSNSAGLLGGFPVKLAE